MNLQYSQIVTSNIPDVAHIWHENEDIEERRTRVLLRNSQDSNFRIPDIDEEGYDPLSLSPEEENRAIQQLLDKVGMRKDNWANILLKDGEMVGIFFRKIC